jgi:hypothetical protein
MLKTTNNTKLNPIILLVVSMVLFLIGSIFAGYLLSKDQDFSPLPSGGGLIMGLIVAMVLSGFVYYVSTRFHKKASDDISYNISTTLIGATVISLLLQYLVRSIS